MGSLASSLAASGSSSSPSSTVSSGVSTMNRLLPCRLCAGASPLAGVKASSESSAAMRAVWSRSSLFWMASCCAQNTSGTSTSSASCGLPCRKEVSSATTASKCAGVLEATKSERSTLVANTGRLPGWKRAALWA